MNGDGDVVQFPGRKQAMGPGDNGGNGELTRHRLNELERRMGALEGKVDELRNTCTRVETSLRYLTWMVGLGFTVLIAAASILGHILLRGLVPS